LSISTHQDQAGGVLVTVRDSGPGIDPEHLERVFQAFYTTKSSGVGMGLSICRSIIDAHGGRLWADANEPRGAVFQLTLPSAEKEPMNPLQVAPEWKAARRHRIGSFSSTGLGSNKRPIVQGSSPVNVIGVGSNEDRRNGVPDFE
jgi:hypothetical protein